jgi:hypothetical protein
LDLFQATSASAEQRGMQSALTRPMLTGLTRKNALERRQQNSKETDPRHDGRSLVT